MASAELSRRVEETRDTAEFQFISARAAA